MPFVIYPGFQVISEANICRMNHVFATENELDGKLDERSSHQTIAIIRRSLNTHSEIV